ncbi:PadR family transcriptional regulator [Brevundimonas sp.]|uniref:PadR family transcriptional regulator n=1 Tax=Brevundimonas sp. TaxID=1871086 RepID=UPI003F72214B
MDHPFWGRRGHGMFGRGMRNEFGRGWPKGGPGGGFGGRGHRGGGKRLLARGDLRWLILSLIAEDGPAHGYELIKAIETRMGGAYAPSPGVIYPTLTLLEEMGALEGREEGGKKRYAITEAGRTLLEENADALTDLREMLAKFAHRAARPVAIAEAIMRLRGAVHAKLAEDIPLDEARIKEVADILNQAADRVEKA